MMGTYYFSFILCLLCLQINSIVAFDPDCKDERIINGTETTIEQYPFMVSIQWYRYHICGGAIVSMEYILTSAKCIGTFKEKELKILAGSTERNNYDGPNVQERNIASFIKHDKYNPFTWANDIIIIKLTAALSMTTTVQPITFYEGEDPVEYWPPLTMIGWGVLVEGDSFYPTNLHAKNMRSFNMMRCIKKMGLHDRIVDPNCMFCATSNDIEGNNTGLRGGPCDGDWGGPVVTMISETNLEMQLVGLASFGLTCRHCFPTVFTYLQGVRIFISNNTGLWTT